jgi:hypothetical protein
VRSVMTSLSLYLSPVLPGVLVLWVAAPVLAQPASDATALSRAYAALAAGRTAEAQRVAEQLLADQPRHHGAATVAVLAASTSGSNTGLDMYEGWLAASRHEDAFILEPVAIAVLHQLGADGGALQEDAKALLTGIPADGGSRSGSATPPTSADRGRQMAADLRGAEGGSKVLRLRSLALTGYLDAVPQVLPLPSDPTPEIRAAAADTLGELGASQAIAPLQALLRDPASEVRSSAALALHRLGDSAGDTMVTELLASGIPDLQLQAADAMAADAPASWVPYVEPLLASDAPMTRLNAARLMLPVAPDKARPVLEGLLAHANPVVVGEMAKILADQRLADLPTIRRLLRHPSGPARLQGATALLRLTGTLP